MILFCCCLEVILCTAINCHNVEYEHNSLYGGLGLQCSVFITQIVHMNLDITLSCLWRPNILLQKYTKEL